MDFHACQRRRVSLCCQRSGGPEPALSEAEGFRPGFLGRNLGSRVARPVLLGTGLHVLSLIGYRIVFLPSSRITGLSPSKYLSKSSRVATLPLAIHFFQDLRLLRYSAW